jgi:hypothetical protein
VAGTARRLEYVFDRILSRNGGHPAAANGREVVAAAQEGKHR